jgi:hypothetical protein
MDILWILWFNCKSRSMDFTFFSVITAETANADKTNGPPKNILSNYNLYYYPRNILCTFTIYLPKIW